MSKLLKAILVVGILWVIGIFMLGAAGATLFSFRHALNFLPRVINVNEEASRVESMTHESHAGEPITVVEVISRNGSVIVTNGENEDINIKATYKVRAESQSAAQARLEALSTAITSNDGVLRIEAKFPSTTISNESIAYEVSLPKGMDVVVRTSNGGIKVVDVTGALRLDTSNGTIEVLGHDGPREITAKTSNGRIIVDAFPVEREGVYDLRTSNGAVTVTVPEEIGVKVQASTSNGSINLGPGQWTISGGEISSKNVSAQRGDGALELRIATSNGNVRIEGQ